MKSTFIATVLATTVGAASAAGVGVAAVYDYNLEKAGVRLQGQAPVVPVDLSVTYINDQYARYGIGKSFDLTTVGPVRVSASVGGVYQDTLAGGTNGYGFTAGVGASMLLAKDVSLTVGVERFAGQDRVKAFNGTSVTAGVNVKF